MKNEQNHIINCLRLEFETEDEREGFRVRNEFSTYWQEWLVGSLQDAFDRYDPSDLIHRIDKIELDLNISSAEDFEKEFKAQFEQQLAEQLKKLRRSSMPQEEVKSNLIADLELLHYFVHQGHYPWWASHHNLSVESLLIRIYKRDKFPLKSFLIAVIKHEALCRRLRYQVSNTLLIQLLSDLFGLEKELSYLLHAHERQPTHTSENDREKMENERLKILMIYLAEDQVNKTDFTKILDNILLSQMSTRVNIKEDSPPTEIEKPLPFNQDEYDEHDQSKRSEVAVPQDVGIKKYGTSHAGLILIAPFLPQFFKKLELLEGAKFKNKACQYRAILLLNYMATGEISGEEQNLLFEKILCGVELWEPIPRFLMLPPEELKEAEALIISAQTHWKPLKNTSLENFRQTFLLREGLCYDEKNQWKLRVEKKPYDMLLNMISWGYHYQTYSWTLKPIETEW